ncbi:MAG: TIGR04282 family arsenosugar biosynthesis glycosyltransferase [Acidobacteriota bacterium]
MAVKLPIVKHGALLTFGKSPVRGEVKTRMQPLLGDDGALALHEALLADAVARMERLAGVADGYLYLTAPAQGIFSVPVRVQEGRDLGERLENAFARAFADGYARVCALGLDSPAIEDGAIASAFEKLGDHDLAIGPCDDGGYYLIGLRRMEPAIFRGIAWGGERVFDDTRRIAEGLGRSVAVLPCSFDVDRPEDLARLRGALDPRIAPRTHSFVEARAC